MNREEKIKIIECPNCNRRIALCYVMKNKDIEIRKVMLYRDHGRVLNRYTLGSGRKVFEALKHINR